MKNWLVKGLIFFLLFGITCSANWQLMLSPQQQELPPFCLIGYDWEVEPFTIALLVGAAVDSEGMTWQVSSQYEETGHYFESISAVLVPAVNLRIEKLDPRRKIAPFLQLRYMRDVFRIGGSELKVPWIPGIDNERPDLSDVDVTEVWEFFRAGGGIRLKTSESFSLLADCGLEVSLVKGDDLRYDNKELVYEENTRWLWVNTYAGLSLAWHW